jgi:hypothetical protein
MRRIERLQLGQVGQRLGWSRSYNRLYSHGIELPSPGQSSQQCRSSPTPDREKPNDSNGSPARPARPAPETVAVERIAQAFFAAGVAPVGERRRAFTQTNYGSGRTVRTDRTASEKTGACSSPGRRDDSDCPDWAPPSGNSARRNPNACVHCGEHCPPSDTANSIRKPDGSWYHLECELAQP